MCCLLEYVCLTERWETRSQWLSFRWLLCQYTDRQPLVQTTSWNWLTDVTLMSFDSRNHRILCVFIILLIIFLYRPGFFCGWFGNRAFLLQSAFSVCQDWFLSMSFLSISFVVVSQTWQLEHTPFFPPPSHHLFYDPQASVYVSPHRVDPIGYCFAVFFSFDRQLRASKV